MFCGMLVKNKDWRQSKISVVDLFNLNMWTTMEVIMATVAFVHSFYMYVSCSLVRRLVYSSATSPALTQLPFHGTSLTHSRFERAYLCFHCYSFDTPSSASTIYPLEVLPRAVPSTSDMDYNIEI